MSELLMLSLAVGGFLALLLLSRELFGRNGKENEAFARNHIEDAMKIKARQYEN